MAAALQRLQEATSEVRVATGERQYLAAVVSAMDKVAALGKSGNGDGNGGEDRFLRMRVPLSVLAAFVGSDGGGRKDLSEHQVNYRATAEVIVVPSIILLNHRRFATWSATC